jgi:ferritin-like metal-binding protein YciE
MPDTRISLEKNSLEYELISSALRDAHAMEEQAITLLTMQSSRLESYPELRNRVRLHLDETKSQLRRVDECLEAIGTEKSTLKDLVQKFTATVGGAFNAMTEDEVLKGSFMSYSFEAFEISCYMSLKTMAEAFGLPEIARMAEENLAEERAMAEWLEQHLPAVTKQYIGLAQRGERAKR